MVNYIVLDGYKTTDYIRGRISGMIHVLAGMPDKGFAWLVTDDYSSWRLAFEGDDQLCQTVVEAVNRFYPNAILEVWTETLDHEEGSA